MATIMASQSPDTITGTAQNDSITGSHGNDLIFGGQGDDTINGAGGPIFLIGNDTLRGGGGNDAPSRAAVCEAAGSQAYDEGRPRRERGQDASWVGVAARPITAIIGRPPRVILEAKPDTACAAQSLRKSGLDAALMHWPGIGRSRGLL